MALIIPKINSQRSIRRLNIANIKYYNIIGKKWLDRELGELTNQLEATWHTSRVSKFIWDVNSLSQRQFCLEINSTELLIIDLFCSYTTFHWMINNIIIVFNQCNSYLYIKGRKCCFFNLRKFTREKIRPSISWRIGHGCYWDKKID